MAVEIYNILKYQSLEHHRVDIYKKTISQFEKYRLP